ncbi:MAG: molybdate ABC transporter permease subunit [Coriobacteriia bacterium]|nr:molybdate ABC transporter permease subunit [Coriobacteriia bacterium]
MSTVKLKRSLQPRALVIIMSVLLFCLLAPAHAAYAATSNTTHQTDTTTSTPVEVSRNGTEAKSADTPFAITDFLRSNKGTSKTYNSSYYGYRYPITAPDAFVVVAKESAILVYLPANHAQELTLNSQDPDTQQAFIRLLEALDLQVANGNLPLATLTTPYLFTTEKSITHQGYLYQFAVEVEPGQYYTCITSESVPTASATTSITAASDTQSSYDKNGALYVDSGRLMPAAVVTITLAPTGAQAVWEFFGGIDYRPFWVSMRTSLTAMFFVFILGLAAAHYSLKINQRVRAVLDSVFTIPMVLPPTVCGFLLLVAFGNSTGFGRWLIDHGVVLIFTWPGAVIAAFVVAFPLMYRTTRGAFESLDPNLGDAARTLGWSDRRIFFRLTLPLAWPSIAAGTVLSFARALGEFGATLFVAGNFVGITQTMPIAIYFQWMGGHTDVATFWVVVVILISFLVILFINWYAAHTQRYRMAGADEGIDEETGFSGPKTKTAKSPGKLLRPG